MRRTGLVVGYAFYSIGAITLSAGPRIFRLSVSFLSFSIVTRSQRASVCWKSASIRPMQSVLYR